MKKILITSRHKERHDEKVYGPYTIVKDFDVFPFFHTGFTPIIFAGVPYTLEQVKSIVADVDGIVLTGGEDIDPGKYDEETMYPNVWTNNFRDQNELYLVEAAISAKKPIFAICRGMQLLNVYFGGSLYQNIKEQADAKLLHMQNEIFSLSHKVKIQSSSTLYSIFKKNTIWVNSFHNQAIHTLGKGLVITAKSSDGIVEAVEHKNLPIIGVQWHPEIAYAFDEYSKKLIHYFMTR